MERRATPSPAGSARARARTSLSAKPAGRTRATLKPVEVAYQNAARLLDELSRVDRAAIFLTMERDYPANLGQVATTTTDQLLAVNGDLNDALNVLMLYSHHEQAFDAAAVTCFRSGDPVQEEAARVVLRLKGVATQLLTIYRAGDCSRGADRLLAASGDARDGEGARIDVTSPPSPTTVAHRPGTKAFIRFQTGLHRLDRNRNEKNVVRWGVACWAWTSAVLAGMSRYLASVDLSRLRADVDAVRLRLKGPFVPTVRQQRLWKTIDERGPIKKEALASALSTGADHLYDRFGLSELRNLGFVEPTSEGYVTVRPLPTTRRGRNSRS